MTVMLTSLQNPRVKLAVKLRERKHRQREGLMLVEGYEELSLALASSARPQTLFVCPDLARSSLFASRLSSLRASDIEIVEVSAPAFEKMAYRENPDGWLAIFPIEKRSLTDWQLPANPLLIVAEAVEKPGNLGAILRSADAAGADGLILCDPTTDAHNPNVVRASKGTLFTVPVVEADGPAALDWLRARSIKIVAATPQANQNYTDTDLRGPLAIAVGTEKEGLSALWLERAHVAVRIPMLGKVNSLNVATATTLLLYEAVRQRAGNRSQKSEVGS
jgi:TrmH family RNA methyltransferase